MIKNIFLLVIVRTQEKLNLQRYSHLEKNINVIVEPHINKIVDVGFFFK